MLHSRCRQVCMRISRCRRSQSISAVTSVPGSGIAAPAAGTWITSSGASPLTVSAIAIASPEASRSTPAVTRLPAARGIEHGAVEPNAAPIGAGHPRRAAAPIAVLAKQQFGHPAFPNSSIPAQAGTHSRSARTCELSRQIIRQIPSLDPFFTLQSRSVMLVHLKPDQAIDPVFRGEARHQLTLVLRNPLREIGSEPDIEGSVRFARQQINEKHRDGRPMGPGLRRDGLERD